MKKDITIKQPWGMVVFCLTILIVSIFWAVKQPETNQVEKNLLATNIRFPKFTETELIYFDPTSNSFQEVSFDNLEESTNLLQLPEGSTPTQVQYADEGEHALGKLNNLFTFFDLHEGESSQINSKGENYTLSPSGSVAYTVRNEDEPYYTSVYIDKDTEPFATIDAGYFEWTGGYIELLFLGDDNILFAVEAESQSGPDWQLLHEGENVAKIGNAILTESFIADRNHQDYLLLDRFLGETESFYGIYDFINHEYAKTSIDIKNNFCKWFDKNHITCLTKDSTGLQLGLIDTNTNEYSLIGDIEETDIDFVRNFHFDQETNTLFMSTETQVYFSKLK